MSDDKRPKRLAESILLVICVAVASSIASLLFFQLYVGHSEYGINIVSHESGLDFGDGFNFSGILITILAFVSAFYILLLAIDAFKISSMVNKNEETITNNSKKIDEVITPQVEAIENAISSVQEKIGDEEARLTRLDYDSSVTAMVFAELYDASEDNRNILQNVIRLSRASELALDGDGDQAKSYIRSIRNEISSLSLKDQIRQSRIILMAQSTSQHAEIDPALIQLAKNEIRALAADGDQRSVQLLKYLEENQAVDS